MRPPHPLPPSASPFTRLDLSPVPLINPEALYQAARSALSAWSPLRVPRLHQPLALAQRALIQRDATLLLRRVGSLSAYYIHVVRPLADAQRDSYEEEELKERPFEEGERGASTLEEAFIIRLCEGVSLLEGELIALEAPLAELVDVDAHHERYKLTARLARFHELYTSYLGEALRCVALNLQAPTPCVALQQPPPAPCEDELSDEEPDVNDEGLEEGLEEELEDELPSRVSVPQSKGKRPSYRQLTHLTWSPRFQPLIERQLSLLTQLSDELERFDQPTRSRWGRS